jgi:hypothetical protein
LISVAVTPGALPAKAGAQSAVASSAAKADFLSIDVSPSLVFDLDEGQQ